MVVAGVRIEIGLRAVNEVFDLRPKAIIERLKLRRPRYQRTASYGHFGGEGHAWEEIVPLTADTQLAKK